MKSYEQQYFEPITYEPRLGRNNEVCEKSSELYIDDNRRAPSPPADVLLWTSIAIFVKKSKCPHLDELLRASPVKCKEVRYIDNKKNEYAYWKVFTKSYDDGPEYYRLWQPYIDFEQSVFNNLNIYECSYESDRMGKLIPLDLGPRYRMYEIDKLILDAHLLDNLPLEQRLIFSIRSRMDHHIFIHESIQSIFTSAQVGGVSIEEQNAYRQRRLELEKKESQS